MAVRGLRCLLVKTSSANLNADNFTAGEMNTIKALRASAPVLA